jgi:hypothetical protein
MPFPHPAPDEFHEPLSEDMVFQYLEYLKKKGGYKGELAGQYALNFYRKDKVKFFQLYAEIKRKLQGHITMGEPPSGNDVIYCGAFCEGILRGQGDWQLYAICLLGCLLLKWKLRKKKRSAKRKRSTKRKAK